MKPRSYFGVCNAVALIHACGLGAMLNWTTAAHAATEPVTSESLKVHTIEVEDKDHLRLNFQGVPLDAVLDYLSRVGGFVIIKSVDVSGKVSVVSHQPLNREETIKLLNTVLNEKGYAAIRNGRTLTIVNRSDAKQRDIPVHVGNQPEEIPKTDEMITQVIPMRHATAQEIIDSIRELVPSYATISANTSSNAVVLTGTQIDVHRITEIIQALDQSISAISSLRVFQLKYADAKESADLINSLFQAQKTATQDNRGGNRGRGGLGMFGGGGFNPAAFFGGGGGGSGDTSGGGGGGNRGGQNPQDRGAALQAASNIVAVADQRTNSVVVSAPTEMLQVIGDLLANIDQSSQANTVVRVFTLQFADAEAMATQITAIFGQGGQAGRAQSGDTGRGGGPGMFFQRLAQAQAQASQTADLSQRKLAEKTVLAQADIRTNSVIVSAASEIMDQVAQVITQLDQNPAKAKKVFVYNVKNADPQQVTNMLQQMFGSTNSANTTFNRTNLGSNTRGSSYNQRNNLNNRNNNFGSNSGFGNNGPRGIGSSR